jgi:hypothetical protein
VNAYWVLRAEIIRATIYTIVLVTLFDATFTLMDTPNCLRRLLTNPAPLDAT